MQNEELRIWCFGFAQQPNNSTNTRINNLDGVIISSGTQMHFVSKEELSRTADEFAQTLIKIEKAESKGIIKNIRNVAVAGSKEDLIAELADKFLALTKKSSGDTTRNLHIASISNNGKINN